MSSTSRTAAIAAVVFALALPAQAITFNFDFDNTGVNGPAGTPTPPIVGTGTLSVNGDLAAGDYDVTTLAGLDISFTFDAVSFTENDIDTTSEAYLRIAGTGDDRTALFYTPLALGNGCAGGAVDFLSGSDCLSTGPSGFTGKFFLASEITLSGNYLGTVVPEPVSSVPLPAGLPLLLSGIAGFLALRRRV